MIKEMLERRRRKKELQDLRKKMAEIGIFTYHLTDDELIEQTLKWVEIVNEAFRPILLSMAQMAEAFQRFGEALDESKRY